MSNNPSRHTNLKEQRRKFLGLTPQQSSDLEQIDQEGQERGDMGSGRNGYQQSTCLSLEELQPFDLVRLQTANSEYNIFIISPESGLSFIQGGRHLPLPMQCEFRGAHLDGLLVLEGSIEIGLGVEIWEKQKRIITSAVQAFTINRISDRIS
jgi:hypothetical protein